jgi:hypothetical protein
MAANNGGRMSTFNPTFVFHTGPDALPLHQASINFLPAPNSFWEGEQASIPTSASSLWMARHGKNFLMVVQH